MRSLSPFIAKAVSAITGMSRVVASPLSSPVARNPSIPGSWISIKMRSGCSACAKATPASASLAFSTVCPTDSSRNVARVMFAELSSTTSTFVISDGGFPTGHCSPDFDREPASIEIGLFHDRRHEPIQLVTVLPVDRFRGEHEDWYPRGAGVLMERVNNVEPAHIGHHQIEHDQVGQLLPRHLDRLCAAIGSQHAARQTVDVQRDQLNGAWIVVHDQNVEPSTRFHRQQA